MGDNVRVRPMVKAVHVMIMGGVKRRAPVTGETT